MDKNVDLCSAIEFIKAHPRLTKSPIEEETFLYVFFCIGASISIGQEIRCLPYAGFFKEQKGISHLLSCNALLYYLAKCSYA